MALDFTSIPDREGVALYIIHTGNTLETQKFERLKEEIERINKSEHQIILIDVQSTDGERVRDFYDISPEQLPAAVLVRDDDSLAQQWYGEYIPTASDIAYNMQQVS